MSAEFSSTIAMSIIERELEIDSTPTPSAVHELVDLYSRAIEHYESLKSSKYMYFQQRMHNMLGRPEILQMLQEYNASENSLKKRASHRRNHSSGIPKEESKKRIPHKEVSPVIERKLKRMVNRNQDSVMHLACRTKQNLEVQDLSLERRLAVRKNENVSRSFALTSFEDSLRSPDKHFELDLSNISEENEHFEEKIEEVMEKSFADKAARIADVRVKYAPQITELQEQGSIGLMVLKQMQAQMNKEIQDINQEIDNKRKEDIAKLRKTFNLSSLG